jgi:membrane protein
MLKTVWLLIKETFIGWHRDDASQLAAALAFYAVLSFAPTAVIVVAISGLVFGREAARGELASKMQEWIDPRSAEFIQDAIASAGEASSGIIAALISLITILFGSTRLFAQLQAALNKVWGVQLKPGRGVKGIIHNRLLSFIMVLGFGFFVLCFLLATTLLPAMSHFLSNLQVVNFLVSFVVTTLLFAMIYKILPDVRIAWRDVWIGSAVTSLLFTLGKFLIGLYIGFSNIGSAYGAAASLFVLLIWVYYSAQVFLLGAEFTEVYATRCGSAMTPGRHAIRIRRSSARETRK